MTFSWNSIRNKKRFPRAFLRISAKLRCNPPLLTHTLARYHQILDAGPSEYLGSWISWHLDTLAAAALRRDFLFLYVKIKSTAFNLNI